MTIVHKHDFLIDEDKLDKKESIDFIGFLYTERGRHEKELYMANINRMEHKEGTVLHFAWESTVKRHMVDIDMINGTIQKLIKKFNLLEKVK